MDSILNFVLISFLILHDAAACAQANKGEKQPWKIDFTAVANPFVNLTHSLLVEMQGIDLLMQVHRWSCLA